MELSVEQKRALAMASARARMANGTQPEAAPEWSGSILPVSRDAQGNVSFDSNAGILGSIKRAVTLPAEVYRGEVDPMSEEGIRRATEMAGVVTPVNPAVRAADYAIPGARNALVPAKKTRVPTAEELKAAGSAGYDAVRDMGVEYSSDAVRAAAKVAKQALEQDGILGNLAPKTHRIIDELANPPEGSTATSAGIEAARRAFGNAAKDFNNPTEQLAASRAIDVLDGFVQAADPASVVAGPASAAGKALADARANYAAAKRSERLAGTDNFGGAEGRAQLAADASNSGANFDNALRQQAKRILQDPKQRAGFTEQEVADLVKIASGSRATNLLRSWGNRLGGGGGIGSVISGMAGMAGALQLGGTSGVALGAAAALPVVGAAMKAGENALARRSILELDKQTRMRSPLYEQLLAQAQSSTNPETYAALMRILTLVGGAEAQPQ